MSDENFIQESLHLQAVLLDKNDEICKGDENLYDIVCLIRYSRWIKLSRDLENLSHLFHL